MLTYQNTEIVNVDIFEELNYLGIMLSRDDEITNAFAALYYIAIKLKPLTTTNPTTNPTRVQLNHTTVNEIGKCVLKNYLDKNIFIDVQVDAIYSYIKSTKKHPTISELSDDIEIFLRKVYEQKKRQR